MLSANQAHDLYKEGVQTSGGHLKLIIDSVIALEAGDPR